MTPLYPFPVDSQYCAFQVIEAHFLAGKGFGSFALFLTTFSTIFSGYTVVGVPQEAALFGYNVLRWISAGQIVLLWYLIYCPRFRRVSHARNYTNPNDILMDRFNLNSLRYVGAFVMCFPQLIYGKNLHWRCTITAISCVLSSIML